MLSIGEAMILTAASLWVMKVVVKDLIKADKRAQ